MRYFMFVAILFTFLNGQSAKADYGPCTKWEKRFGYTCVFNERTAHEWVRQCFHIYDNTLACMPEGTDPNKLKNSCTRWVRANGVVTCSNGVRWERRWVRGCTDRLQSEEFCSDTIDPNTIGHKLVPPQNENDPRRNPNYDPVRNPNRRPLN
jgi:hypothetical protein